MQDKLCRPDDYGPCNSCERHVTLVLGFNAERLPQEAVDSQPDRRWTCEKCVEARKSSFVLRADQWQPDEVTKVVLAGADPILTNAFLEMQSLIATVFNE